MVYVWTATRHLTKQVKDGIIYRVSLLKPGDVCVLGGCVGGDAFIARAAWKKTDVHVHVVLPANRNQVDPGWSAYCHSYEAMAVGSDYRARNQRLVTIGLLKCGMLIGCPALPEEHIDSRRSGTWMTIRMARKQNLPHEIIRWWL